MIWLDIALGGIVALGLFLTAVEGFTALAWWRLKRYGWKP